MRISSTVVFVGLVYVLLLIAMLALVNGAGASQDKVTLCHGAGLEGTTHYETLNIAYPAAFGQAGHFYEDGTPRAGHEQDYLGSCIVPTVTPTITPFPTPTPTPTLIPTETPVPTVEPTITPTPTATPELTPSPTPDVSTSTQVPTFTASPSPAPQFPVAFPETGGRP